jgi:quinol monooxygenase YgiN
MHAVIVTVTIAAGQFDAARKVLQEQAVPRVKQMPGFVKAYWTRSADGAHGTSMVVFTTKQNADEAASTVRSTAPPFVTVNGVEVAEVVAEA